MIRVIPPSYFFVLLILVIFVTAPVKASSSVWMGNKHRVVKDTGREWTKTTECKHRIPTCTVNISTYLETKEMRQVYKHSPYECLPLHPPLTNTFLLLTFLRLMVPSLKVDVKIVRKSGTLTRAYTKYYSDLCFKHDNYHFLVPCKIYLYLVGNNVNPMILYNNF